MRTFAAKELHSQEKRVALIPETVEKLSKAGLDICVEQGLGISCGYSDEDYERAGAQVASDRVAALESAELVLRIRKPAAEEIEHLRRDCIHLSHLDPFNERDLVERFARQGVSAISLEMIPRTTRAQKMDVLSSQANLAGYYAAILAAERLNKALPMMMTPAGTLKPSRVFVIGAGVAGLQAIATAKRLGAIVEAFDTRPVVEEQVKSLGAKFVKVDLGETGQTKDGYAKELTPEQLDKQRQAMAKVCAQSDIVITTAQLFGRKAPIIVTADMVKAMHPGSIIIDMAVESGGNVEGSVLGEEVEVQGVRIVGTPNLPGQVAVHASQMYSANLYNFIDEYWDKENKTLRLPLEDEIIKGCLITHEGAIINETIKTVYAEA